MSEFNKEETDYEDQLRQSERERKDLKISYMNFR